MTSNLKVALTAKATTLVCNNSNKLIDSLLLQIIAKASTILDSDWHIHGVTDSLARYV